MGFRRLGNFLKPIFNFPNNRFQFPPALLHLITRYFEPMPEEVLAKMASKVPLQELGKPEDIANVYAFLSSDQARYISGTTISVDGGITL